MIDNNNNNKNNNNKNNNNNKGNININAIDDESTANVGSSNQFTVSVNNNRSNVTRNNQEVRDSRLSSSFKNHSEGKVIIKSLIIDNWKCFDFKEISFNSGSNFFNQNNGYGKTAIIQAIIFCIYGKLPIGSSTISLQNKRRKGEKISLKLIFSVGNKNYTVKREITRVSQKVCVFESEEDSREYSVGQMNEIMERFFGDKKYIDVIWSQSSLTNSDVLKNSFTTKLISEYLEEEKRFVDELKVKNLMLSKEKKKITQALSNVKKNESEVKNIRLRLESRRDQLLNKLKDKTKSSLNESKKAMAERCLSAQNRIKEIKENYLTLYTERDINLYNKLLMNKESNLNIIKDYSVELSNEFDRFKKYFTAREMNKLIKITEETHKCPICNSNFQFNFSENDLSKFSEKEKFEKATNEINSLEGFNEDLITVSKEYYSLIKEASMFKDPQKVIDEYDKQTEEEWKTLDIVNNKIKQCEICEQYFKSLSNIDANMKAIAKLIEISKEYETECIAHYTNSIIYKASKLLSGIDDKYLGISYNTSTSGYDVCVSDGRNLDSRPVESFSSGEKTVVALCLVLAYKEIFAPNSILILDESLSNVDPDHLENCLQLLDNVDYQTIVVAHNRKHGD